MLNRQKVRYQSNSNPLESISSNDDSCELSIQSWRRHPLPKQKLDFIPIPKKLDFSRCFLGISDYRTSKGFKNSGHSWTHRSVDLTVWKALSVYQPELELFLDIPRSEWTGRNSDGPLSGLRMKIYDFQRFKISSKVNNLI